MFFTDSHSLSRNYFIYFIWPTNTITELARQLKPSSLKRHASKAALFASHSYYLLTSTQCLQDQSCGACVLYNYELFVSHTSQAYLMCQNMGHVTGHWGTWRKVGGWHAFRLGNFHSLYGFWQLKSHILALQRPATLNTYPKSVNIAAKPPELNENLPMSQAFWQGDEATISSGLSVTDRWWTIHNCTVFFLV